MWTGMPAEHSWEPQTQGECTFTAVSHGAQEKDWGQD